MNQTAKVADPFGNMLWICLLVGVLIALFLWYRKLCNYWNEKGVTSVKPLPLFGNMLPIILRQKSLIEVATDVYYSAPNAR